MKSIIFAIGGGRMYTKETLKIDKYIVNLTKKKNPQALFIPTASKDNAEYCESFKSIYGDLLNCKIDYLLLCKESGTMTINKIVNMVERADLIYVSGGNTLYMMKVWRKIGLDKILERAYSNGKILGGMSAGAVCWFKGGFSDSFKNKYTVVRGIGLIDAYCSPHFNNTEVKSNFLKRLNDKKRESVWYSLEDNTALIINHKSNIEIIKSSSSAQAYKFIKQKNNTYKQSRLK